jgi:uncharacterized membrane protein YedE/YeeE
MKAAVGLLSGLIFGLGLALSGMLDPARVLGFLDVAGHWDPTLAFVLAGAVAVSFAGYRLSLRMARPAFAERFDVPVATRIDRRLLAGAVLFGIGWGLAGFCPGPAIASFGLLRAGSLLFVAAMLIGMAIYRFLPSRPYRMPA